MIGVENPKKQNENYSNYEKVRGCERVHEYVFVRENNSRYIFFYYLLNMQWWYIKHSIIALSAIEFLKITCSFRFNRYRHIPFHNFVSFTHSDSVHLVDANFHTKFFGFFIRVIKFGWSGCRRCGSNCVCVCVVTVKLSAQCSTEAKWTVNFAFAHIEFDLHIDYHLLYVRIIHDRLEWCKLSPFMVN